jgi:hypothetical protein
LPFWAFTAAREVDGGDAVGVGVDVFLFEIEKLDQPFDASSAAFDMDFPNISKVPPKPLDGAGADAGELGAGEAL